MREKTQWVVALALLCCLLAAPALAKKPLANIALQWRPTTTFAEMGAVNLTGLEKAAIKLEPLVDKRDKADPQLIGENREGEAKKQILPVTTKDNVPEFCTTNIGIVLKKLGLPMVDDNPTVIIGGDLMSFFVTETDVYVGEVTIKAKVTDVKGNVLWTGMANGASKRWGRSYKDENYLEVLTDSVMDAISGLLKDTRFIDALAGKGAPK
jgi:hypothetical protein